jgi:hypothetical protein
MLQQLPLSPLTQLPHALDIVPQDSTPPVNSFRVSELKEIKKDLGTYTENPDQYIQAFRGVSPNFELSWKDVVLLLSQNLTSLDKQWVLDQAVTAGDNYHLDKSGPHRKRRRREKKDKGIGYLKGNLNFQFQQKIRQCLGMTPSGTLKMTRMNGVITISSTAFLRV